LLPMSHTLRPDSDGRCHESGICVILRVRVISLSTAKQNNKLAKKKVAASNCEHEVPQLPCSLAAVSAELFDETPKMVAVM
jgi:hypothetical protein